MVNPSFKLTRYSMGSLQEIGAISWPLILSLFSASLMHFSDRLFLSRFSVETLNAATTSGTAAYSLLILPMIVASISQVFVGRIHGESNFKDMGRPVWQMIYFSLMTIPLFILAAWCLPYLYFSNSSLREQETIYFRWILYFSPIFTLNAALCGFFLGSGKVKIVTFCVFAANFLNILLDILLIYGVGPLPSFGIKGAAIATGVAEAFFTLLLFLLFLSRENRSRYKTSQALFDKKLFFESIKVGLPAGLGVAIEVNAHFGFMKILTFAGHLELTIASLLQSVYFLVMFLPDGLSKAVTTLSANFIGGRAYRAIPKMLRSAFVLHSLFFLSLAFFLTLFFKDILWVFFNGNDLKLLENREFIQKSASCFFYFSLFFLMSGFAKILIGHLTAAHDTGFILLTDLVLIIFCYLIPVYYAIFISNGGAVEAWLIFFIYSLICFIVFFCRTYLIPSSFAEEEELE